jgi:integrase
MTNSPNTSSRIFTDRTLKALPPAKSGQRYELWDRSLRGFGVRVSDAKGANGKAGQIIFVLYMRWPNGNPSRRTLGRYGEITLEAARAKARAWRQQVEQGIDPAIEHEKKKAEQLRTQNVSFEKVAEDFIRDKLKDERRGSEAERELRRIFIPAWGKRPISDITPLEVREIIKGFRDAGKLAAAHNLLGYVRRLFAWAIDQHIYGLEVSPCAQLKPKSIIGEKAVRTRVLSDRELRAVWLAADKVGYPFGPLTRLLLLTGVRKSEAAEASRSEVDLDKKLWTIPVERMKAAAVFAVPLSQDAVTLLKSLPRFDKGDYLFSSTFGRTPVNAFSAAKLRLDAAVGLQLGHTPLPWVIHDIRRSVRTHLSALPGVSDLVRELVIGHSKRGLHKVYDQHAYLDEKRHALEMWAARLRNIVEPTSGNVVELARRV